MQLRVEVLDIKYNTSSGRVKFITITDGNEQRDVTPYQVFKAFLSNAIVSNSMELALYGINIIHNNKRIQVEIADMTKSDIKELKSKIKIQPEKTDKALSKEEEKVNKLAIERNNFIKRQQEEIERNRRLAEEARKNGLRNLTPEQRRELRQQHFKQKALENKQTAQV